jgi:6-methylpretetramide 4-monooxygenase / 4-hydroxy-6-methylpretetramide 12a-monooxygenase
MRTAGSTDIEVLVVGAGPVGLTAAHELARRGVKVRLVDRALAPATTSRATATHARTLELYHQMGVLDDLLPRGRQVEHFTMHCGGRRLIRFDTDYSTLPTRFPFTLQVDQAITEEILRKAVRALGVEVEWAVTLETLVQHQDFVVAGLRRGDGTAEELRVPWLIGADGGHSTVRKQLGLRLLGDSTQTWLVADALVDVDLPGDSVHWMYVGGGTILLVPFPTQGKWRLLDTVDVNRHDDPKVIAAKFAEKITTAVGAPVQVSTPTWVSVFVIQQRMVQQMQVGHCFVAGDAAHVHSPASGQGLNTGIQDAVNLAWKLADVVRGLAASELLDSYSIERVPIGKALLSSTKTATALIALRNVAAPALLPLSLGLINLIRPIKRKVERKIMAAMSGLALNYADSPLSLPAKPGGIEPGHRVNCSADMVQTSAGWRELCTELTDPRWTLLAFVDADDQLQALHQFDRDYGKAVSVRAIVKDTRISGLNTLADSDGSLAEGLGGRPGHWMLIRPDGYLAGKGQLTSQDQLVKALRRLHLMPSKHAQAPR